MESAIPILLFLGGLFALVMFALTMGILSREQERKEAEERAARPALDRLTGPRFFAKLEPSTDTKSPPVSRGSVIDTLERYLGAERVGARRFVAEPSAASLLRNGDRRAGVVVGRVEQYLREERQIVKGPGCDEQAPRFDTGEATAPRFESLPWMLPQDTIVSEAHSVSAADGSSDDDRTHGSRR